MYSKICGLLISVLLALSIFNVGSISVKAEAVYNVGLEIETAEMPINWIQEGDGVSLLVKIKNNPGVDDFSFCYKTDNKITNEIGSTMTTKGEYPSWNILTYYFHDPDKTYRLLIRNFNHDSSEKFCANGWLCYITVYLDSNNVQVGDFYPVDFITNPIEEDYEIGFNIDGIFYNYENITEYLNGGIKVVAPQVKYTPVDGNNVVEEPVQSLQSVEIETQGDKPNNQLNDLITETIQHEDEQSISETIIETNDTTVSNTETKIITTATKKVTSEKKISESSVSVTEGAVESTTSEYHIDNTQKNKEENKVVKPVIFSSVLVLAAITVTLLIRKIKRKKEDR